MKYTKEREFVKKANEYLKQEVTISRINILETGEKDDELVYVMYEDKFRRQYQVYKKNNEYTKHEYIPLTNNE